MTEKKQREYASQDVLKNKMINALIANDFHINNSVNQIGISKKTYYNWMENDNEFSQRVEEAKLDLIQSIQAQYQQILRNGIENVSIVEKEMYDAKGLLVGKEKTTTKKRYQAKPNELLAYLERKAPKEWGYDRSQSQNDVQEVEFIEED